MGSSEMNYQIRQASLDDVLSALNLLHDNIIVPSIRLPKLSSLIMIPLSWLPLTSLHWPCRREPVGAICCKVDDQQVYPLGKESLCEYPTGLRIYFIIFLTYLLIYACIAIYGMLSYKNICSYRWCYYVTSGCLKS
jgi:hypothetical protein